MSAIWSATIETLSDTLDIIVETIELRADSEREAWQRLATLRPFPLSVRLRYARPVQQVTLGEVAR